MTRFVLLDRDGVINRRVCGGYVTSWTEFAFLPCALDALRLLSQNGYLALVVSNQACVGKGLVSAAELAEITRRFVEKVQEHGGRIDGVYYCPHREEDGCECRKPRPGLLLEAQRKYGFDFAKTFLIGDSETDLLAAYHVGCPCLLVTDRASERFRDVPHRPVAFFSSLLEAAHFLVFKQI